MKTIRDLLSRDLTEPIEEVIKLDQQDEQTVYNEITEYVATDRIKDQYLEVLKAIADAPGEPTEGVGVWISGFFGSGKSSFAKNLGYILANREILGHPASQLFVKQLQEQAPTDPVVQRLADTVNFINTRFDAHVIMFDVQVDRAVRNITEPIAEIMYTVLLRELDYALDYDIAELEMHLEGEGRLENFIRICADKYRDQVKDTRGTDGVPITLPDVAAEDYAVWQMVRKGAERIQRSSAVLHQMDPGTYPDPDTWATSHGEANITIRLLVSRTFELAERRRPGHAVIFIIDEVGQYVARSVDKIENLRAVVEHFGQESKNRVQKGKAVAPVWVIVTSQEKLDEVVAAIDDKRVELAKLQDRFAIRIDLSPADIREVATRRVLAKTPEAQSLLQQRYEEAAAVLKTHTRLEHTARRVDLTPAQFVQFYPYLPHFVDLSIDIVSGIRLQPGASRHIGGSSRTIIKQTYEMLVSPRTALASAPVGTLVTLDRVFELIEGNVSSEKQKDIGDVVQRWPDDPWPARVVKAIALLEYVRDLPRSEENLSALLYPHLGSDSVSADVERAVRLLSEAQFIRRTEEGWKLQTAREKSWTAERNAFNPAPRERNDLLEDQLRTAFSEPSLTRFRYGNLKNFRVGVSWNGRTLTSGDAQVPVLLRIADGPDIFAETCNQARDDSRAESHRNNIFWVMSLTDEIDEVVAETYRSRQMVAKYNQLRAQGKLIKEESSSLEDEKTETMRLGERLQGQLESALAGGQGYFRGVEKAGASLGKTPTEIFKGLFAFTVPDLYPKLEMGARPLKGNEAEEILKAASLSGLPRIYYTPPDGLDLVTREGNKYVVNTNAPIVKEVLGYIASEHSNGNKVTGRTLETHFGGIGYGWDQEILWLVLASLLRAGAIEVTYQGRRYRNHLDPQVRTPFSKTNAFRSASFAPRKAPDLKTQVDAARRYEALTGDEVDVEETAIAQAFQDLARSELEALLPVEATVRAHRIPLTEVLNEYHQDLEMILNSASDDCVNRLAGEGASFQELRDQVAMIRKAIDEEGLARLRRIRSAVDRLWPLLHDEGENGELSDSAQLLRQRLAEGTYFQKSVEVNQAIERLEASYRELYEARHKKRGAAFSHAIDAVRAQPDWTLVPEDMQDSLLQPLVARGCDDFSLDGGAVACASCHASLAEMVSDLAAVDHLRSNVILQLHQLTAPEEKVERVKISAVTGGEAIETPEEVEEMVQRLRDHLLKLIASGIRVVLE